MMDQDAHRQCGVCGGLPDYLKVRTGSDESFPLSVKQLIRLHLGQDADLYQCPSCNSLFRWQDLPQFYGSGNNWEEELTRLPDASAAAAWGLLELSDDSAAGTRVLQRAFEELSPEVVCEIVGRLRATRPAAFGQLVSGLVDQFIRTGDAGVVRILENYCREDSQGASAVCELLGSDPRPKSKAAEVPLLAAVCGHPENEALRLAYATEIKASDPDRALLIELQLEHRAARRRGIEPDQRRVRELVAAHGARWAGWLIPGVAQRYEFYGGFVELLEVDAAKLLSSSPYLIAQHAPIRHLRVRQAKAHVDELAGLDRFGGLVLKMLSRLVSLDVSNCELEDADIETLVRSPHLGGLRMLDISGNPTGIGALRAIARAGLPALQYVDAEMTRAPLLIHITDTDGSIRESTWTSLRATLVAEFGHRPWLDAQRKPHLDSL